MQVTPFRIAAIFQQRAPFPPCLYLRLADWVTLPGAVVPGVCSWRSASMKVKLLGGAAQSNREPPAALLSRFNLNSNKVPDPERGVKSFEQADTRSVLIGPVPGSTFPDTFQLPPVIPAF